MSRYYHEPATNVGRALAILAVAFAAALAISMLSGCQSMRPERQVNALVYNEAHPNSDGVFTALSNATQTLRGLQPEFDAEGNAYFELPDGRRITANGLLVMLGDNERSADIDMATALQLLHQLRNAGVGQGAVQPVDDSTGTGGPTDVSPAIDDADTIAPEINVPTGGGASIDASGEPLPAD